MTETTAYDADTALDAFYTSRTSRTTARLFAIETEMERLQKIGILTYFKGPGPDPTTLADYSSGSLWLKTNSSGVNSASGSVWRWTGVAPASNDVNWVELDKSGFLTHLGESPDDAVDWITTNTTLNVPATYATIADALAYLSTKSIAPTAFVTIQVADGTYAMGSGMSFTHAHGSQIKILGNLAAPANCVLRWDVGAVAGFRIMPGQTLGMIDGFEMQCSTTITGRAVGGAGILCDSGVITVGPSMIVRRFYFGIMARLGGIIWANGTSGSNRVQVFTSGDAAYIAIYGGVIYAAYAYASGTTAVPDGDNRWGIGFVAEANGVIYAQYSTSTANMWAGYGAFTSGVIWGGRLTATNATGGATRNGDGLVAYYGGVVDGGDSTITGNAGFAIYESEGGIVSEYGTMTMSLNADGERQNKLLFARAAPGANPELQASGADTNIGIVIRSKGTGSVFLNANGATAFAALSDASAVNHMYARAAATGGPPILHTNGSDADIDMCFAPKGAGVLRFGTYTATPGAITGYMTIKDFAGNARKIAVTT